MCPSRAKMGTGSQTAIPTFLTGRGPPGGYPLPHAAGLQAQAVSPLPSRACEHGCQVCCYCANSQGKDRKGSLLVLERSVVPSTCKTLYCRGMVTRLVWAKASSSLHTPPPQKTSGHLINLCFIIFASVDARARDWPGNTSLLPTAPAHTHALQPLECTTVGFPSPTARSGSCSRRVAGVATSSHHSAFSLTLFLHSLFAPSPSPRSGATGSSPVGTSACDSATGRVMASDSPLQQDQYPSDEKREAQGELCCLLLCCTTLSSFFISPGFWT